MGFRSILRKLSTSLVRAVLSMLFILMLFLHFWNLTPMGYIGAVMDDVFEHADPISKDAFAQTVLSVCDKVGGSMTGALLGRAQDIAGEKAGEGVEVSDDALGLMVDICTKEDTLAEAREECDWLKSFPATKKFPAGMDSMFDSVDDLETACDAIESEEFTETCEPFKAFGSGGQMAGILTTLEDGCSKYKQGQSGEDAAKALIMGIAGSTMGQDMGSIGDLIPDDTQDPSSKRMLSILDTALTVVSKIKESIIIHIATILLLIGLIVLINLKHLDYAVKKISFGMIGPTVSILLPYTLLQLYLTFVQVDTSGFFLALQGTTQFTTNIGSVIPSLLPFLIVRTYTMSLIIAALGLAVLGLLVRAAGLAALKTAKKEKKEEGKEKEKKAKEKKKPEEKKGLFSKVLPKRKKPEEKKEKSAEEKKEGKKPKEEPKVPKPGEKPAEKKEEKKPEPKKAK